jgi:hypothetical protein
VIVLIEVLSSGISARLVLGVIFMGRRRDGGSRMSEAGRTAAARLVHRWHRLEREPECPGRVLVHLDGVVTCSGKC